ncbi:MAG TPA: hypothetical protein QGF58_26225 [Myxococcota bacterium]|nr:hypothetical protein [Myxococcota bacterium]
MFALLACVGAIDLDTGGDGVVSGETGVDRFSVEIDEDVLSRLGDRLAEVQNDDGSYDWQRAEDEELIPELTGYQNVTGVSAWGFYAAQERVGEREDWQEATARAADYFDGLLDAAIADGSGLSCPNYTVLVWELESNPDPVLEARTIAGFEAMLSAHDDRARGFLENLAERRSAIPGIIPWDDALCVEAAREMSELSPVFAEDAADAEAVLVAELEDTFLPAWDADPSLLWGDISIGWSLRVLAESQDAELIDGLTERLVVLVDEEGRITNGSDDDGPQQATAYGLMGLKAVEHDLSQRVQDFAESEVDPDGIVLGGAGETYEVSGELLRALAE